MQNLVSETDIREKILVPWLKEAGISIDMVKMEHSFTIQLGRGIYEINSKRQRDSGAGRADYLIKSCTNINLFIVEAKNISLDLTEEDRDQAVSYARLVSVGNIPPFAIVTNGNITKLYDVISKEEITLSSLSNHTNIKSDFKIDCNLSYKVEALQYLVSLSPENLLEFCKGQVEYRMNSLKSTDIFSGKKYVPQLYCDRKEAYEKLNDILFNEKEPKQIALVTGPPQHGKTSFLCNTVETLISGGTPCLFYPAIGIKNGLLKAIQEDFQWIFNNDLSTFHIVKQLQSILSKVGSSLIFIIDGLNEVDKQKAFEINEECARISFKELKLIVSATSNSLSRILFEADNATYIADSVNVTRKDVEILQRKDLRQTENKQIIQIGEFSKIETEKAINIYKKAYSVMVSNVDLILSNPFYLGRAMELYAGKELPSQLNTKELIYESLIRKGKRANKEVIELKIDLCKISKELFDKDSPITDFKTLQIHPESLTKLCDVAIISEVHDENGHHGLDFYYSRERDYVIAYELRNWNKVFLEEESIIEEINLAFKTTVGKEALRWFFSCSLHIEHLKLVYGLVNNLDLFNELFSFAIFNQNFEKSEDLTWLGNVLNKILSKDFTHEPYEPEEKALVIYKVIESSKVNPDFITSNQIFLIKELLLYETSIEDYQLQESFSMELFNVGLDKIYGGLLLDTNREIAMASALLMASDYSSSEFFTNTLISYITEENDKFLYNKDCFIEALKCISDRACDPMCGDVFSYEREIDEWVSYLEEYNNEFEKIIDFYKSTNPLSYFRDTILDIQNEIIKQCNQDPALLEEYKDIVAGFKPKNWPNVELS